MIWRIFFYVYCTSFITVKSVFEFYHRSNSGKPPCIYCNVVYFFQQLVLRYSFCLCCSSVDTISFVIYDSFFSNKSSFLFLTHRLGEIWSWYFSHECGPFVMKCVIFALTATVGNICALLVRFFVFLVLPWKILMYPLLAMF